MHRLTLLLTLTLLVFSHSVAPARAQEAAAPLQTALIEGRPAATVPTGPNVNLLAPDGSGVVLYEMQRIKRTPPLDPIPGLQGNWDPLYSTRVSDGLRTGYFDWDDRFIYLGMEAPAPTHVRFEMDLGNDGWLRGTDNLVIQVGPNGSVTPAGIQEVTAYRFDTVQNKDRPVWAGPQIPVSEMQVRSGRTVNGGYAVTIAVPRRDDIGLVFKPGSSFGLRFETGGLPDPATENALEIKPMLRLTLAEAVPAIVPGTLAVTLALDSEQVPPGEGLKATLEIKNQTKTVQRVGQMFLKGSLSAQTLVDSATFAGADIPPGKSIKRELRSSVAPTSPIGAVVFSGGIDQGSSSVVALSSFRRVEPYEVQFEIEPRPVVGGGETAKGDSRTARVILKSHIKARDSAKVTLSLPEGWGLESGKLVEEKQLNHQGDVQGLYYKFLVPPSAQPGEYTLSATVELAGKTYRRSDTVMILR